MNTRTFSALIKLAAETNTGASSPPAPKSNPTTPTSPTTGGGSRPNQPSAGMFAAADKWIRENPRAWQAIKYIGIPVLGGTMVSSLFGAKSPLLWGLLAGGLGLGYGSTVGDWSTLTKKQQNPPSSSPAANTGGSQTKQTKIQKKEQASEKQQPPEIKSTSREPEETDGERKRSVFDRPWRF